MATGMSPDRLAEIIDACGADPRRWPEAERAAAEALLAASAEARALQREAAALDALLTPAPARIEPSDALRARIMAQAASLAAAQPRRAGWRQQVAEAAGFLFPGGRMMPQLATLAFALAIGIGAGFTNLGMADSQDSDLVTLQLASAAPVYLEE